MAVQGSHDTDARKHRWSIQLRDQHQGARSGLPFGGVRFFLRERHDVGRGVPQIHKRFALRRRDRIVERALEPDCFGKTRTIPISRSRIFELIAIGPFAPMRRLNVDVRFI